MEQLEREPQIEALFPGLDVVAFATKQLLTDFDEQYKAETDFIENAIEGRRLEFLTGRACARAAIRSLGHDVGELPVGEGRQPVWPLGVTAAITHTRREGRQFVAAVAALDHGDSVGIGVDAEVVQPLKDGVRDMILTDGEAIALRDLPKTNRQAGAIRAFSAKEAFYKAQYALTRGWVGFGDMRLDRLDGSGQLHQTGNLEVLASIQTPTPFQQTQLDELIVSGVAALRR